jgi:hypothetical protein
MSFGKRSHTSPPRPSERAVSSGSPAKPSPRGGDDEGDIISSKLLAQLGILGAVACGVLLFAFGMPDGLVGTGSAAKGPGVTEVFGAHTPSDKLSRRPALQSVHRACLPALSDAEETRLGARSGFWSRIEAMARDGSGSKLDAYADYLVCAMGRERERLCDPADRADLVGEIGGYLRDIATDTRRHAFRQKVLNGESVGSGNANVQRWAESVTRDAADKNGISTDAAAPELRDDVAILIRGLIAQGYLVAGDFGWSPPELLAPHLANIEREKDSCK